MGLEELRQTVVDALEEIKGRDIVALDVSQLTSVTDAMIIASADSSRQTRAMAHNVREKVRAKHGGVLGVEGEDSGEWILVDLGDVVVHIMHPAVRQYYNLEELWGNRSVPPMYPAAVAIES